MNILKTEDTNRAEMIPVRSIHLARFGMSEEEKMDYSEPKLRRMKFFNVVEHWGGSRNAPELFEDWDTLKCNKCDIKPKKLKSEERHSSEMTGRGQLGRRWKEVTIQCPRCKAIDKYNTHPIESDESYYSNEERRAYRM